MIKSTLKKIFKTRFFKTLRYAINKKPDIFINASTFVDYKSGNQYQMKNILIFFYLIISISYGNDTSKVVQTHNNGKISMISYYQDTEEGLELIKQETFHFSGPKSMVGNFKNGIRNGDWTYWHENGMKRLEGSYLMVSKMDYGQDGMGME